MNRNVRITVKKNSQGEFEFEMKEGGGPDTEILVFNKTKDGIPKSEFYDVVFTLVNQGTNLAFVTDPGSVMFLSKGSDKHLPKCPKSQSPTSDGQFSVISVTDSVLTVQNKDDYDCFYKFALNFVDRDNNNAPVAFDPIWGNQNGGGGGFQLISPTTSTFVGGMALGILLTVVAYNVLPMMG